MSVKLLNEQLSIVLSTTHSTMAVWLEHAKGA
jgi:hypothetical protein